MIIAVADGDWSVLETSLDGDSSVGLAMGPKGTLVTASALLARSVNETRTLNFLPKSASTSWYLGESAPTFVSVTPSTRIHW